MLHHGLIYGISHMTNNPNMTDSLVTGGKQPVITQMTQLMIDW